MQTPSLAFSSQFSRLSRKYEAVKWRAGVIFSLLPWFAGCAGPGSGPAGGSRPSGVAVTERAVPPPTSDVTRSQAWRDAEAVASMEPGRLTVIGAGDSMRPIYGENTVLVLQKVPYSELTAGMNVAYMNEAGRVVLHRLVVQDAQGWRAVGLNNDYEDRERVRPDNLLGIVYAAFANSDVK